MDRSNDLDCFKGDQTGDDQKLTLSTMGQSCTRHVRDEESVRKLRDPWSALSSPTTFLGGLHQDVIIAKWQTDGGRDRTVEGVHGGLRLAAASQAQIHPSTFGTRCS